MPDCTRPADKGTALPMNGSGRLPQSLGLRVITGVVAGALVVAGVFLLDATAVAAAAGAVALAAGWEWSRLAGLRRPAARLAYLALLAMVGLSVWGSGAAVLQAVLAVTALWWVGVSLWLIRGGRTRTPPPGVGTRVGALALGLPVLCTLMFAVAVLVSAPGVDRGVLLYALCLVWAADVGAYFAGRRWGRRALAPGISAGKTWEGLAGGLLAVLVYALAAAGALGLPGSQLPMWLLLALLAGAVSVSGDLFVSLLKRAAGVKDSGRLLPGHGGLLDRIDSLLAAIPILALGLRGLPFGLLP